MAGVAWGSSANAAFFLVSPGGVPGGAGKNRRGCPGEIGRAAGFPFSLENAGQGGSQICHQS